MAFLSYGDLPAVLDVYTPCQAEHGIADAAASRHARLAVESRMNPVFVHDLRRGNSPRQWFSLDGNPEADQGLGDDHAWNISTSAARRSCWNCR